MCQIGTVNTVENKTKFLLSIRVHLQHEIILNTVDHRTVTIPMATETFKTDDLIAKILEGHGEIWLTLVRRGTNFDLIILLLEPPKHPITFDQNRCQVVWRELNPSYAYKPLKKNQLYIYIYNSPILSI